LILWARDFNFRYKFSHKTNLKSAIICEAQRGLRHSRQAKDKMLFFEYRTAEYRISNIEVATADYRILTHFK